MRKRDMRFRFGWTILLAHFGTILAYIVLGGLYYPTDNKVSDIAQGVLTVAAISSLYGLTFLKYVTSNTDKIEPDANVVVEADAYRVQYFIVCLFSSFLFLGVVVLFIVGFNYENIRVFSGAIDTLFGAYLLVIFDRLFPKEILGA